MLVHGLWLGMSIELDMTGIDIILGMQCFYACYAAIICITGVLDFNFVIALEWKDMYLKANSFRDLKFER